MAAMGAWPVPLALYGRFGSVAGLLGPEWSPWGLDRSFKPRMAAVWAWPVPLLAYGRTGGVAGPLGPVWPPWRLAKSLSFV